MKKVCKGKNYQKGFTLIELLLVIGILIVLLAIVIVAINPARQFALAHDTKRKSDVNTILDAIQQYAVDNSGTLPTGITTAEQDISSTTSANICAQLVTKYIAALPVDPNTNSGAPISNCGGAYETNYHVYKSATDNRVTVLAPGAENSAVSVTR